MANLGTPPADPLDTELWRLSRVSTMNWDRELATCSRLLRLLSETDGEVGAPAKRLKLALMSTANYAYDRYLDKESSERHFASEVLAGAALVGLITLAPGEIREGERPNSRGVRSASLDMRRTMAAKWHYEGVSASSFQRRRKDKNTGKAKPSYEDESFEAFRNALIETVRDNASTTLASDKDTAEATSNLTARLPSAGPTPHAGAVSQPNSFDPSQYVHRSEYEAKFGELVKRGKRLIILVGQAGIGKSWMARYVTRLPDGTNAPSIRMVDGRPHLQDVQNAYSSLRVDTQHVIGTSAENFLTHLTHCEQAPEFVVLDDLSSTDELASLSLSGSKSIIVITSRTEGDIPLGQAEIIYVNAMNVNESKELVDRLLPSLRPMESERLNFFLAGHPLAIAYACRLIAYRQGAGVWELIAELDRNCTRIAEEVRTTEGAVLRTTLESVGVYLRERDEDAYELLVFIGLLDITGDSPRKRKFLKHYYAQAIDKDYEVSYTNAVMLLQKLGLVVILETGELVADKLTCDFLFWPTYTTHVVSFVSRMKSLLAMYIRRGAAPGDPDLDYAVPLSINVLTMVILKERLRGKFGPAEAARWTEKFMGYDLLGKSGTVNFESIMHSWFQYFEEFRRRELE